MNRRIALSFLSIFAALALVSGATYAYFQGTNESTGNIFSTGTLDVRLGDNTDSYSLDPITASIGGTNMVPGGTPITGYIMVHNSGSIPAAEVEIGANRTDHDGDEYLMEDLLNLNIETGSDNTCTTDGVDRTTTIAGVIGDDLPPLTLGELINEDYDALPGLAANTGADDSDQYYVCMSIALDANADNNYQGDTLTVEFVFTANQDASQ